MPLPFISFALRLGFPDPVNALFTNWAAFCTALDDVPGAGAVDEVTMANVAVCVRPLWSSA
jgi:hypothetical protein